MSIHVVGLGPGPADLVTRRAAGLLASPEARVFLRTEHHPAIAELLEGQAAESFDGLFEQAESHDAVTEGIASALLEAARSADLVVYAVPGDGLLGESAVQVLREHRAQVTVVAGVSDTSAALAAAGLSAGDSAQIAEATALGGAGIERGFEPSPRSVLVVAAAYSRAVLSDAKLALMEVYPAGQRVLVVHHPGLGDEQVTEAVLSELDRTASSLDHLTSLVVPPVVTEVPTGSERGLRAIVARLRALEIGCPWDLEQTHESLRQYLVEEAYEVAEAIEEGSSGDVMEELGDVLLQVYLHAEIADQEGDFNLNDVMRTLSEKLIRRHPHVFGEVEVSGADEVVKNWDVLKAAEKGANAPPPSALKKVNRAQPALVQASEMMRQAAKAGFLWRERADSLAKVREELDELLAAETVADRGEELGDLLWMLVYLGQSDGIDAEDALRAAVRKFERRFQVMEGLSRERGWDGFNERSTAELLAIWSEAKAQVREDAQAE